jgi:hypothetical protein
MDLAAALSQVRRRARQSPPNPSVRPDWSSTQGHPPKAAAPKAVTSKAGPFEGAPRKVVPQTLDPKLLIPSKVLIPSAVPSAALTSIPFTEYDPASQSAQSGT